MRVDEVRTLIHSRPFVPFTIHMADGREFRIEHPDFVATAHRSDTIVVYQEDDTFNVVDLALATDAHVGAPA